MSRPGWAPEAPGAGRRAPNPPVSFPDEPPGLVAGGAWQQAPEMNGRRRAPMQGAVQNPAYRPGDMPMAGAWRDLHAPVSKRPNRFMQTKKNRRVGEGLPRAGL